MSDAPPGGRPPPQYQPLYDVPTGDLNEGDSGDGLAFTQRALVLRSRSLRRGDRVGRVHRGGSDEPRRQRQPAARHQHDLAALRHVVQNCVASVAVKPSARRRGRARNASRLETLRLLDPRAPLVIAHERLGVQHRAAILEDAGARVKQLAVPERVKMRTMGMSEVRKQEATSTPLRAASTKPRAAAAARRGRRR